MSNLSSQTQQGESSPPPSSSSSSEGPPRSSPAPSTTTTTTAAGPPLGPCDVTIDVKREECEQYIEIFGCTAVFTLPFDTTQGQNEWRVKGKNTGGMIPMDGVSSPDYTFTVVRFQEKGIFLSSDEPVTGTTVTFAVNFASATDDIVEIMALAQGIDGLGTGVVLCGPLVP